MEKDRGFTLIELLLSLSIILALLSLTVPVSTSLLRSYRNSLLASKIMVFISDLKRECFLHGEEAEITSLDGSLVINGKKKEFPGAYVMVDNKLKIYRNGTTNGGRVLLSIERENYVIEILPPFSDLILRASKNEKRK